MSVDPRDFQEYKRVIDHQLFDDIIRLAERLRGKRVLIINSNQNRGGVYEHLSSVVPLLQSLGIKTVWKGITEVPADFYEVTKRIYNNIQGIEFPFTPKHWKIYEDFNKGIAKEVEEDSRDFVFVHDHQMLGALSQVKHKGRTKWIWQSHSETYKPNESFVNQMKKYILPFDGVILYLPEYAFKNIHPKKIIFSTIAIDPLSTKNTPISRHKARQIIEQFGIDSNRPVITQISRVDSWKDFPGVVDAWLIAKKIVPKLQLVFVCVVSWNNIHAKEIINQINNKTEGQEDFHFLINKVERKYIKAFQTASDVVVHKSLREGFGLVVSEALWSATPVIGGNVGGIKVQIVNGKGGYLVDSVDECARRIIELIQNPRKARTMGKFGREHIRRHFLLPRLIRDELQLMVDLAN